MLRSEEPAENRKYGRMGLQMCACSSMDSFAEEGHTLWRMYTKSNFSTNAQDFFIREEKFCVNVKLGPKTSSATGQKNWARSSVPEVKVTYSVKLAQSMFPNNHLRRFTLVEMRKICPLTFASLSTNLTSVRVCYQTHRCVTECEGLGPWV